jgi:hypothetical protein
MNAYWTRAECPCPGGKSTRPGRPAGPMPDRTPQRNPHAPVLDFSPHVTAYHPRPPRLLVTPPPIANAYPGLSATRSRPIRPRNAVNNAGGTATSAIWNVTAFACESRFRARSKREPDGPALGSRSPNEEDKERNSFRNALQKTPGSRRLKWLSRNDQNWLRSPDRSQTFAFNRWIGSGRDRQSPQALLALFLA